MSQVHQALQRAQDAIAQAVWQIHSTDHKLLLELYQVEQEAPVQILEADQISDIRQAQLTGHAHKIVLQVSLTEPTDCVRLKRLLDLLLAVMARTPKSGPVIGNTRALERIDLQL